MFRHYSMIVLFLFVTACQSQPVVREPTAEGYQLVRDDACARMPAAAPQCRRVYFKDANAGIIDNLPYDVGLRAQVEDINRQLAQKKQISPIARASARVAEFRAKYLPYFKIDSTRESTVKWMEADLRLKSLYLKNRIKAGEQTDYDAVIVGTGVHGIITLHSLLAQKPNMKVLILDSSDTGGATFRYAGDTFSINSSNRPSSPDSLPLPGKGNINELPGLPIQVSDISPVKYPSAGDLGSALVAGLHSAVTEYKNVDVLLNTDAESVSRPGGRGGLKYEVGVRLSGSGQLRAIRAQKVIVSTGLGSPQVPPSVARSLKNNPQLLETPNIATTLPRVMTFEDVMRVISQSNDPKKYFANKRIAVVGVGDSANVFIEFLLGYASRLGYGQSDGQTAGPKKIFWIGQDKETCKQFISDIRSRYAQIGTGYRSSDPNAEPIITGIRPKLKAVYPSGRSAALELETPVFGRATRVLEDERTVNADITILATGFKGGLAELFKSLIPESALNKDNLEKDADFLTAYFKFLEQKTSTSANQPTRVARYAGRFDVNGKALPDDPSVFVVGPAAGKLPKENELVGIIQNTVSIFNNAPRSYATGEFIAKGTKLEAQPLAPEQPVLNLTNTKNITGYQVTGLSEVRNLGSASQSYIYAVAKQVAQYVKVEGQNPGNLTIEFAKKGKDLIVKPSDRVRLGKLVDTLTETRDFFNILNQLLSYSPGTSLFIRYLETGDYKVEFLTETGSSVGDTVTVENNSVYLRGID